MSKSKKEKTYQLKDGNKIVYIGKTDDLNRRAEEHKREGKKFTKILETSRSVSETTAFQREEEQLRKYRNSHKGKNPRYNKTSK